jgi:hypothetical protein
MVKTFEVTPDGTADKRTLAFKHPTYKETMALDMEYRRAFSEAVRNGVMTNAEAIKSMKKTGAWTDEDDAEISRRIIEVSDLEVKLGERKGEPEELVKLANDLMKKRNDLLAEMNKRTELFENTAEGVADQCRIYKMIYYCLLDEDGNRFFSTEEEFEQFTEKYPSAISYMYRKAYFFQYDVDENVSDRWAEVQYLKERADSLKEDLENLREEEAATAEAVAAATESEE